MPSYHDSKGKAVARHQIMGVYTKETGRSFIDKTYCYLALCAEQPDVPGAEINQMVASGFLMKNQYFGVDLDENVIEANKRHHPGGNWFAGHWVDVIRSIYIHISPALVHYDSVQSAENKAFAKNVATTLNIFSARPIGLIVAATAMLENRHSGERYDAKKLRAKILPHLHWGDRWELGRDCFSYRSSRTDMGIYIFRKVR